MMNPFAVIGIVSQVMTVLPKLIQAIQQIMASDAAHTVESAVSQLVNHVTPGQPNAPALSPTAQAIDFQAPKG